MRIVKARDRTRHKSALTPLAQKALCCHLKPAPCKLALGQTDRSPFGCQHHGVFVLVIPRHVRGWD